MKRWLRRIRAAIGMGLTWAVVWAPVAIVVGTRIIDPDDSMDEMWWMVGAMPGFLSGVMFSVVLGTVAHRRRLDELSIPRVAGWGALAGLMIGVLPNVLGDTGGGPWMLQATVLIASFTLLSAASAAGSLALAQRAQKRELLNAGAGLNDVGLTKGEVQELLPKR